MVDETLQAALNAGAYGAQAAQSYISGVQSGGGGSSAAADYNARIAALKSPNSPFKDFNFMTYEQAYGLPTKSATPNISFPAMNFAAAAQPQITAASLSDPNSSPVAYGFPLFAQMVQLILQAEESKRQGINQTLDIANTFANLARTSPTRAADLAAQLGMQEPSFDFTKVFNQGSKVADSIGGTIQGMIGTQNVSLPGTLSGRQLSWLTANPNVANIIKDIGDRLGTPDILSRSAAGAIPTSQSIIEAAFA